MSTDLDTIKELAKGTFMPDFFGARIDEEGLWGALRQLLAGIQAAPNTRIDKIKQCAAPAATACDFIDKIKAANLWLALQELVGRIQVK
jgi:hypothetical protein